MKAMTRHDSLMPYDYDDDLLHFSSVLCCLSLVSYFRWQGRDFKNDTTTEMYRNQYTYPSVSNYSPPLPYCRNDNLTEIEMLQDQYSVLIHLQNQALITIQGVQKEDLYNSGFSTYRDAQAMVVAREYRQCYDNTFHIYIIFAL